MSDRIDQKRQANQGWTTQNMHGLIDPTRIDDKIESLEMTKIDKKVKAR